jgi:TPR repeat protein
MSTRYAPLVCLLILAGCRRECSTGESCYAQAQDLVKRIYPDGRSRSEAEVAQHGAQAVALFQRGCDLGSARSCLMAGIWLEKDDLVASDVPRAVRLHEHACALKEFRSCDRLAYIYKEGRGVPKNPALKAKYRKLACDLAEPPMAKDAFCEPESADQAMGHDCSDGESCFRQAQLLEGNYFDFKSGRDRSAGPEKAAAWAARAVVLHEKACDLGDDRSCMALGENFRLGSTQPVDIPRAIRFFEKGCRHKDSVSCLELATLYRNGEGIPKNPSLHAKYRKLACNFAPADDKDRFCNDKD